MTERPKKEKRSNHTRALVVGVVVGTFAGALTTLLLLDDDDDAAADDDIPHPDRPARSTRTPLDDGDRLPN